MPAFIHRVDGDNQIIACEAYNIAMKTASDLQTVPTPLADSFIESLDEDSNQNVIATFELNGVNHSLTLNERLTRNKSLNKVKENLLKIKTAIIDNMVANIHDQNTEDSLLGLFSVFDLSSDEDFDSRIGKLSTLYNIYGVANEHSMKEKWNGLIKIVYKARLSCSKNELLEQFEKAWPKITSLHQELLNAPKPKPSQLKLWQKFLQRNTISLGGLCHYALYSS